MTSFQRSPLQPIFDPEIRQGQMFVGATPATPPPSGPLLMVDWRGLSGPPDGWIDNGNVGYEADGVHSTVDWDVGAGDIGLLTYGPLGSFAAGTIAVAFLHIVGTGATSQVGLHSAGYAENAFVEISNDDSWAGARHTDGFPGGSFNEVASDAAYRVEIMRWSDADGLLRGTHYSDVDGRDDVSDSGWSVVTSPLVSDFFDIPVTGDSSPASDCAVVLTAIWDREINDDECDALAVSWGITLP